MADKSTNPSVVDRVLQACLLPGQLLTAPAAVSAIAREGEV